MLDEHKQLALWWTLWSLSVEEALGMMGGQPCLWEKERVFIYHPGLVLNQGVDHLCLAACSPAVASITPFAIPGPAEVDFHPGRPRPGSGYRKPKRFACDGAALLLAPWFGWKKYCIFWGGGRKEASLDLCSGFWCFSYSSVSIKCG